MSLLDFFKNSNKDHVSSSGLNFDELFHQISSEANAKSQTYNFNAYLKLDAVKRLVEQDHQTQVAYLLYSCELIVRSYLELRKKNTYSFNAPWAHGLKLIPLLLKSVTLNDDELSLVAKGFRSFRENEISSFQLPTQFLLSEIETAVRKKGLTPKLREALEQLRVDVNDQSYRDQIKQNERIQFLLEGEHDVEVSKHDAWGRLVISYLSESSPAIKEAWIKLFAVAKRSSSKSEPPQKWIKEAQAAIGAVGHALYSQKMIEWLNFIKAVIQDIHKDKVDDFLRDENHDILKGLIWCAGFINDPALNISLDDYASWAYKKKPMVGPISVKTGSAAMCAFSMLPIKDGVSRLSKFRTKIKNNTILKSIDKFIRTVSENNNVTVDEIEELSVPDFNIVNEELTVELSDCKAKYNIKEGDLKWERAGKLQKSIPNDIKENFGDDLKRIKNTIKEIDSLIPVLKDRLERSYLRQRTWNYKSWMELYIHHPLTSIVARKLIWHFFRQEQKEQGIYSNGKFIDQHGNEISFLDDSTQVQLWHPIGFTADYILRWRNFMRENSIVQPFKQAYREVYIITDAELRTEVYSNRFAAHILRQHQFAALCRQRGWHYQLMGQWDSHNTPYIELPSWNMSAQYYVNSDLNEAHVNGMGIYNFVSTDQVRFMRNNEPLMMHDVPALVFSEIMRDVDLFVGVTSIGSDPAWQDGADPFLNNYWQHYSFGDLSESANVRSQVLESLIPRLKIAPQCSFNKKFLIVRGKVRTYKIHMGSGNILMEPDDQYLCIVPEGKTKPKEKVFLPFEGDNLLSIIISKAFLLADDDKIKDKTILSQINRGKNLQR